MPSSRSTVFVTGLMCACFTERPAIVGGDSTSGFPGPDSASHSSGERATEAAESGQTDGNPGLDTDGVATGTASTDPSGDDAGSVTTDGTGSTDSGDTIAVTAEGVDGAQNLTEGSTTHSCVRTTAGRARCWGSNAHGEIGNNSTANALTAQEVSGLADVTELDTGYWHTCAGVTGGAVYCWGDNGVGQLGDDSTTDSPVPVRVSGT